MICPYCKMNYLTRHVKFCKKKDPNKNDEELRSYYLELNFPSLFGYNNIYEIYVIKKMSLPDIKKVYNIDYKNIQFMLNFYNIDIRGSSEGCKNSMFKREATNIKRYGAKNVLSKGTEKYYKKNKTVNDKYGVSNVFQIPEIIKKINDDEYYLDKYGLTRSELVRKNSINYFNSLSDEEKNNWHNKMSNSFSNKVNKANKGKVHQSKLENKIDDCLIDMKIEYIKQYIITYGNKCYFYDFFIKSINTIIEVNGDYWHANPIKYKPDHKFRGYTAEEKWTKDKDKCNKAIENGHNIIYIWENEIKKLKKEEIIKYLIIKLQIYSNEDNITI